ncbi:MAG: hypothetical protein JWP30_1026 [Homoserinimonas sp.]|jgi:hypothetical protein|nr:hypothetical protein [Homoserinimonas sp.]
MTVGSELAAALWAGAATLLAAFALVVGAGFWALFRRRKRPAAHVHGASKAQLSLQNRANILLVRADDAVRAGEEELAYALAQFGAQQTADYSRGLAAARARVMEAFTLQQRLDDALPDTDTQRRDWAARIIHLCETAQAGLAAEGRRFDELRQLEKNAVPNLTSVRARITLLAARRGAAASMLASLQATYAEGAVASVADNLERADEVLARAHTHANAAAANLGTTGATAVVDAIRAAEDSANQADHLFTAIEALTVELGTASAAVDELVRSTEETLEEARVIRDDPPDAASSTAINHAIESVGRTLSALDRSHPLAALDRLREANANLDISLAGARNQQRRLEGARAALTGALVAARSQLAVTGEFIATRRGSVGPEARTRLAEAERLLGVAELEADPVTALDTARSSASYSRDADALARYDAR